MSEKIHLQRFGEKLRRLRNHYGLTLVELASLLGYATHTYLSEVENNKKLPTVEMVLKISRRFNISTDVLLKDELELHDLEQISTEEQL